MKKISVNEAIEDVEIAFLQVEYTLKVNAYWDRDDFEVSHFDTDLVVQLPERNLNFPTKRFSSKNEILKASEVAISVAYGITALTLDQALETAGHKINPKSDNEFDHIRCIVYLVRCAYAHRIAQPYWDVRTDKQRIYRYHLSSGELISVDAKALNGSDFDFRQIGGHAAWHDIKEIIVGNISKHNQTRDMR